MLLEVISFGKLSSVFTMLVHSVVQFYSSFHSLEPSVNCSENGLLVAEPSGEV